METGKYTVIVKSSFDLETVSVYEIENYEEAVSFLEWLWEDYYNEEIANGSELEASECYHEEEYARVTWACESYYTEFFLRPLLQPDARWIKEQEVS